MKETIKQIFKELGIEYIITGNSVCISSDNTYDEHAYKLEIQNNWIRDDSINALVIGESKQAVLVYALSLLLLAENLND